jgi:hypothetical protein
MTKQAFVIFTEPAQRECVCGGSTVAMVHQQLALLSSRLPGATEANFEEIWMPRFEPETT